MASDAIAVIDYVGWNNGRELHVVGVSLGGMISQGDFLLYFCANFTEPMQNSHSKSPSASSH
jgi:hypothetical protein